MHFDDALLSFTLCCRAAGSINETTIRHYEEDLRLFYKRFPGAMETWTRDHMRMFLGNDRWSAATKLVRYKALAAFFEFCVEDGILVQSPMAGVERPKGAKKARKPERLTEHDMEALLLAWPEWTWMGLRNRAILWCFFTMPFRLSELAGLATGDTDLANGDVRTRRKKGSDEGYGATIFPKAARAIDRYRRKLPEELRNKPYLWVAKAGRAMTSHAIQQMLRRTERRAREAGLTKRFWAHAFRHNWGMQTVEWGLAKDVAATTMGHSSDDAVDIYRQWVAERAGQSQIRKIAGYGT